MSARHDTTLMYAEAAESGSAVQRLLTANANVLADLAAQWRADPPRLIVTCARGSSDHAATYGKYLFETLLGLPVVSAAPSVASVFGKHPAQAQGTVCITISQSGASPDLLATVEAQRAAGAQIVALVNEESSPLAAMADTLIALKAGPERSVAATKSCLTAMAALVALVAAITGDPALSDAVVALPATLDAAFAADWSVLHEALLAPNNLFVIGRGLGLGPVLEMALKLKETTGLHAEGLSAAEVRHGPMAIVDAGFPVLAIASSDVSGHSVRQTAADFAARGACVMLADPDHKLGEPEGGNLLHLPLAASHPAIEPLAALASFYRACNSLSLARGLSPDRPAHLAKVTQTV